MIEPSKFRFTDFNTNLHELEIQFVEEIENLIVSRLFDEGKLEISENEIIEFSGRTNYKIRLKRPHKNVWSVPIHVLKENIRKVLRNGGAIEGKIVNLDDRKVNDSNIELPIKILLQSVPEDEYKNRTFVGNHVTHKIYGEGIIQRITENENIEVAFKDREVLLKPDFCALIT